MDKLGVLDIISCSEDLNPSAPSEFQVLKYGKNTIRNGLLKHTFDFTEKDADVIIQAFNEKAVDLNIDYDHQSIDPKANGAIAAGWGGALIKGDNGLIVKMKEWTSKAKKHIENKEYKYFSPVVVFNKDYRPARIFNIALTNTPKLDGISALIASETFNFNQPTQPKGNSKMIQKLMMALGMNVAFSEKPQEEQEAGVISKVKELLSSQEDAKSFLAMHEKPDFNAVTGMIQSMVTIDKLNEVKNQLVKRDAGEVVALAMSEGKIADNFKGWAVSFAEKDIEGFKVWSQNAPKIVPDNANTDQKKIDAGKVISMAEDVKNVYESCGINLEDVKKFKENK